MQTMEGEASVNTPFYSHISQQRIASNQQSIPAPMHVLHSQKNVIINIIQSECRSPDISGVYDPIPAKLIKLKSQSWLNVLLYQ